MKCAIRFAVGTAACLLIASSMGTSAWGQSGSDPTNYPAFTSRKPYQRGVWLLKQRAFPLDDTPDGALLRAYQQVRAFDAAAMRLPTQPVSGNRWIGIGPAPILRGQIGFTGSTRNMAGRVSDVVVHPTNPNHWLVGGAFGGVWRTLDAGATWTPLTDGQPSQAVGAIALAESNPNIIYVGTGEGVFSGDAFTGVGLLKSTDGGGSWQVLAATNFNKLSFSDIRVSPTDPNLLVAALVRGASGRPGSPPPPNPPLTGVFRSTDGGVSWTRTLGGQSTDLEVNRSDFNVQFAALGFPGPQATNGVYRSTDGGQSWTLLTGPWAAQAGGVGRVELALAPSNPNTLYVSIQDAFNGTVNDGSLLGIWRTDNALAATPTWTQLADPPRTGQTGVGVQCWYDHEIIVDPANASVLYFGEVNLWRFNGTVWQDVSRMWTVPLQGIHADQHTMAWAGRRLIVGNDGGVWSTTDDGGSFADHNSNLSITQYYDGSLHPTDPNFAIGGTQDNGTQLWRGQPGWDWIWGGDGCANAISSGNPNNAWALSSQFLAIVRTTDGGQSFISGDAGINKSGVPFIARFEKSPTVDDVMIAGTDTLWRTANFWSAGTPSWTANGPDMNEEITGLAFAASDLAASMYAFGTEFGQLRVTANGGATWANPDPGNAVPNRFVTDLAFNPTNANELYVCLSGFDEGTPGQPGHVFRTTNAFAASPVWQNVSPPVNLPANTIAVDPFATPILYVGTDLGVWKSPDGGASWSHMGPAQGLPNVAVFDLQINHNTDRLIAFTHGRGAYALQSTPLTTNLADVAISMLASPNPIASGQTLTYDLAITNLGPAAATNVVVTDVLPSGVSFVSAGSGQGIAVFSNGTVTASFTAIAAGAGATLNIRVIPFVSGVITNTATVASAEFDPNPLNNSATVLTSVDVPVFNMVAAGRTLVGEGFFPPNGAVEPGETVTVNFGVENLGTGGAANLMGVLLPGGGVTPVDGNARAFGPVIGGAGPVARPFTFTAGNGAGGVLTASLLVFQGAQNLGTLTYTLPIGGTNGAANPGGIVISNFGPAAPYPSVIEISNVSGVLSKATVTFNKFSHKFPDDVDVLLVGPGGQKVMLMSDAGGSTGATNLFFTFDDAATFALPDSAALVSGAFQPSDFETDSNLPAPAPAGPYAAALSAFNGQSPNGTWSLYVSDDTAADDGSVAAGWSLALTTLSALNAPGDLRLGIMVSTNQATVGRPLTYTLAVTNAGTNTAHGVLISNRLPASAAFMSGFATQGLLSNAADLVTIALGSLSPGSTARVEIVASPVATGLLTNAASVFAAQSELSPANNTAAAVVLAIAPLPVVVPGGSVLVAESLSPSNGGLDAGETVTLSLLLRNDGTAPTTNLVATLLATGGVSAPSTPQVYGTLAPDGGTAAMPFTFLADGQAGGVIVATLQLQDGSVSLGTATFAFNLARTLSLTNSAPIVIPQAGAAAPYPSELNVSGVSGVVRKVVVRFRDFSHGFVDDVDALLVSPAGQKVMLMSDAGGNLAVGGLNLTFDDDAALSLPDDGPFLSGVFAPADFEPGDNLPLPAPARPYASRLDAFNGISPNGVWSLYLADDTGGDSGLVASGWTLDISTVDPVNPIADVGVNVAGGLSPVVAGDQITYTLVVSNAGPAMATGVVVSNVVSGLAKVIFAAGNRGITSVSGNTIAWNLDGLVSGGAAFLTIVAVPQGPGVVTNRASAIASEADFFQFNNTVSLLVTVSPPPRATLASDGLDVNGNFQLRFDGRDGLQYVVEASTDLVNWVPISTNAPFLGRVTFSDSATAGNPVRFYRARLASP